KMVQPGRIGIMAAARRPNADLHDFVEIVPVRLAADRRIDLAEVEQRQNDVIEFFGMCEVRHGEIDMVEADDLDTFGNEIAHATHAFAITLSRNWPHASSCTRATNSSALCACSIEPGPQITDGMPARWKWPASVPYETASAWLAP